MSVSVLLWIDDGSGRSGGIDNGVELFGDFWVEELARDEGSELVVISFTHEIWQSQAFEVHVKNSIEEFVRYFCFRPVPIG